MTPEEIAGIDAAHIWHPYAAPGADTLIVDSAQGTQLTLTDGRILLDAMSSWWAACHGHSHPRLIAAARRQIDQMSHVMFGGITHEPAARLTANLLDLTGQNYDQVFYSDSGSVGVEVAIKMALQYSRGAGHPERTRLLTWRSGYHGDTFEAMSVCDPDGGMHALWGDAVATQRFAPAPPVRGSDPGDYLERFAALIDDSIAAVIIEPVVQGAGGMRFHDAELVRGVHRLCQEHGILMIADEIATGFGRTGALFTTLDNGVVPDILCVGKALTGGFVTLAATLATERVAKTMEPSALMHGPTFMANPLACAVAAESTALIAEGDWRRQVPRIEKELIDGLAPLSDTPGVADVRVLGAIGVIELVDEVDMAAATAAAVNHGVWIRPFGRLIYAMPPYISTSEEIAAITRAMRAAVAGSIS
ncbi:adenosylmethionine--8-amino-7-oxononanoate transaminase [Corynebacterium yudongzhengii]|uniref:Adenosylmethionine-8-amino-7-oxononanoate aminotransferase n=1 Tax=Corynebacterium yudongzhengii TaxID=2080740 RepID=A0A2U1T634_9CORY|nr:adenosylmethionine--8-amino-7-oxononanoate transaminase [Corynebacterium yudongzhengii]AWB81990.1 adenosylmethionine--8-amino-7-oxononanoate transaminase [Corynebacterium yudongzhengii]PWC01452.1 adenosylmethionine--8-amino-7-oxononanoate transaminase [Corynebacterium yudongzhengii]